MTEKIERKLQGEATSLVTQAKEFKVTSRATYESAAEFLTGAVKALQARIKAHHAPMLEKAMESKRAAEATRKSIVDGTAELLAPTLEAERVVKAAMVRWLDAEERRKAKLVEKAKVEERPAPVVQARPVVAGVAPKKGWTFRVVDPSKVKLKYMTVNEVAIRKVVNGLGKDAEDVVGGIAVEQETSIAAGAR